MVLGDTRRLIRNFRRAGFMVEHTTDSTGRRCWNVFYPRMHHNFDTGQNIITKEYLGKIERYGCSERNNRAISGRPFFYVTSDSISQYDRGIEAKKIAENTIRATVRWQF